MDPNNQLNYQQIMQTRIKYGYYSLVNNLCCLLISFSIGFHFVILSIIVPVMDKDFKMTSFQKMVIAQTVFIGTFIGNMLGGYLGDKYGRRTALVISNALSILFGYLSAYSISANIYILVRILIAVFMGITLVLSFTYLDEVAFKGWRQRNTVLYNIFCQFGEIIMTLIAGSCLKTIDQGDWRFYIKVSNLAVLFTVVLSLFIPESIIYQLEKNRFQQAFDNIDYAIQFNHSDPQLLTEFEKQQIINTYQNKQQQIEQQDGFMVIYQSQYLVNVLFVSLQCLFITFVYFSLVWILPVQIKRDFIGNGNMQKLFLTLTYIVGFIFSCFLLLALNIAWIKFDKLYLILMTLILILVLAGFFIKHTVYLILVIKGLQNVAFDSIMIFAAQLFPTLMKARAFGVVQTCGKIGGIMMPFVLYYVIEMDLQTYLICIFGVLCVSLLAAIVLINLLRYPQQYDYVEFNNTDP